MMRAFTRERLMIMEGALRLEAAGMPEDEWNFWIGIYKALAKERRLLSLSPVCMMGARSAARGVGMWKREGGGMSEKEARLIQQVFEMILLSSTVCSAESCSPAPPWEIVRVWVVSKLCSDHEPQDMGEPQEKTANNGKSAMDMDSSPRNASGLATDERATDDRATNERATHDSVGNGQKEDLLQQARGSNLGRQVGAASTETQMAFNYQVRQDMDSKQPGEDLKVTVDEDLEVTVDANPRRERRDAQLLELEKRLARHRYDLLNLKGKKEENRHSNRLMSAPQQLLNHASPSGSGSGGGQGHWYKQQVLGKGGFATVFRGFLWKAHGGVEFIAIKEVAKQKNAKDACRVCDKMMREVEVMAKLKHTHLVRYYGHSSKCENPYILMEYCSDGTLRDFVSSCCNAHSLPLKVMHLTAGTPGKSGSPWHPGKGSVEAGQDARGGWKRYVKSTAGTYLLQIAQGLHHMHQCNMIHRDLKAANVLLADHGRCAKISDFGETHAAPAGELPLVYPEGCASGFTLGHVAPEFFWQANNSAHTRNTPQHFLIKVSPSAFPWPPLLQNIVSFIGLFCKRDI